MPEFARELRERPEVRAELEALRAVVRAPMAYPALASGDVLWERISTRMVSADVVALHRRTGWRRLAAPRTWVPLVGALAAAIIVGTVILPRRAPIEQVASASSYQPSTVSPVETSADTGVPGGTVEDGHAAASPAGERRPANAGRASVSSAGRARMTDTVDVARSPYAGTPLDGTAGESARSVALTTPDEDPGAADTHWP
jgi:hypothetical protein